MASCSVLRFLAASEHVYFFKVNMFCSKLADGLTHFIRSRGCCNRQIDHRIVAACLELGEQGVFS